MWLLLPLPLPLQWPYLAEFSSPPQTSALLKELHVIYTSINKVILDTISNTLSTSMRQVVLKKPLFLLEGKLIGEPVPNLRQEPLYPSSKGGDGVFLLLICPIKIPHQQVKGFYIPIYNREFL